MFYFHEQKLLWVIFHLWDGDLLPEMQGFFISWWILLFLDQLLLLTNGLIKIHNFLSCLHLPGHKQTYSCCNQPCNSPPLVILPLWRASPGKTPTNKCNSFHPPKTNKKDYQLRARELRKRKNVALYFTHTDREMLTTPLQRILQLWKMHTPTGDLGLWEMPISARTNTTLGPTPGKGSGLQRFFLPVWPNHPLHGQKWI